MSDLLSLEPVIYVWVLWFPCGRNLPCIQRLMVGPIPKRTGIVYTGQLASATNDTTCSCADDSARKLPSPPARQVLAG